MFTQLPVSGLHRLFTNSPATSHASHEQQHLESITEEAHTHDLLYPTIDTLLNAQQHAAPLGHIEPTLAASAANSFDDWGNLELPPGGIRVILAQDGNPASQQPRVLYDSLPQPTQPQAGGSPGRTRTDSRRSWEGPKRAEAGAMRTQQGRRTSISGYSPRSPSENNRSPTSPQQDSRGAFNKPSSRGKESIRSAEEGETSFARVSKERQEEANTLLGCMFGSTGLSTVSSTKLHINPLALGNTAGNTGNLRRSNAPGSFRPSARRRTPLTRSMTAEEIQAIALSRRAVDMGRDSVTYSNTSTLITRVFSVEKPIPIKIATDAPVVECEGNRSTQSANEKIKQSKVPRYAVGLILHLPQVKTRLDGSVPFLGRSAPSSTEQSGSGNSWDYGDGSTTDFEVERLMRHWNNLTRALAQFEAVARSEIQRQFSQYYHDEDAVVQKHSPEAISSSQPTARRKKIKHASQRTVQLPDSALQQSPSITYAVGVVQRNLASALNTRRVITGQGRWGVWREEARWVSRWAKSKEQHFLYTLLTAFFGNHNQWLRSAGLDWVGPHIFTKPAEDATIIRHRTVIICSEKMAARRLIFLLSAFFPSAFVAARIDKPERPMSSKANSALSASPPTAPLSREVSLRRTIGRRPKDERIGSPVHLHDRSISLSNPDSPVDDDIPINSPSHARRTSDARSIRSLALPIPQSSSHTRKSSISTDATAIAGGDVPVAHFSGTIPYRGGTTPTPRPGSSGSLASLSLKRTLSRSDSSGLSPTSPSTSRWGSMLSGFWTTRRGSSTEGTDPMASSQDGLGISGISYSTSPRSPKKLERMVEEAASSSVVKESVGDTLRGPPSPENITEATPAKDIPEREKPEEFPLKLSVDTSDGVIDIDLPPSNSYPSSYGSSTNSQHPAHVSSNSYNDQTAFHARIAAANSLSAKENSAVDVAGWLKRYQPDFALQAVHPYEKVYKEIRESMRMEPTEDSCTTLIADATTFTVTRLTLRADAEATKNPGKSSPHPPNPAARTFLEETFTDHEPILATALDRIFAQSGQPGHPPHTQARDMDPVRQTSSHTSNMSNLEVPGRECKKLIMGALDKVAKKVMADTERFHNGEDSLSANNEAKTKEPWSNPLRQAISQWLEESKSPR